jgi:RNA polymerase sigma-70 factor, ECF subfamily
LAALAARAAGADSDAFAELIEALSPVWFAVAVATLGDRALAEEVVQDTAVKVFYALPTWKRRASIETWSHRIVLNGCHDVRRRAGFARRLVPLESISDATLHDESMSSDPLASAAIARAVSTLPPELAVVVSLRYGAELGFAEIAEALALPIGTVSTRLRRALALLAPALGPEFSPDRT